jgi:hypothetical protein
MVLFRGLSPPFWLKIGLDRQRGKTTFGAYRLQVSPLVDAGRKLGTIIVLSRSTKTTEWGIVSIVKLPAVRSRC